MLKSSIWGVVCALGIASLSVTACSADVKSGSCDPNDPSCAAPADKGGVTKTPAKDGGGSPGKPGTPNPPNTPTPKPGSDAGPPAATDGGPAGSESACTAKTTANDCISCCISFHQAGDQVAGQAFGDCVCATPGTCKTECAASFCAQNGPDPKMGDACDTCLNTADKGACGATAKSACDGNADCKAIGACIATNKCDAKM